MKYNLGLLKTLCDGNRTSKEIAEIVGCPQKYVQKQMVKFDLPRLSHGARRGELNPSFVAGRIIDLDGYALVSTPDGHKGRRSGRILEHRLVMERLIGRRLKAKETVDHIDGLHLHNCPTNLRLYQTNADHLRATLAGQTPAWSIAGLDRMNSNRHQRANGQPVDIYHLRKKRGDVRLQQILRLWLSPDIDALHLLGTHHLLERIQIDWRSRSSLKQALDTLLIRLEQDLLPSES